MPGVLDFTLPPGAPLRAGKAPAVYRGDSWSHRFEFFDAAGAPFPVSGTLVAQVRARRLIEAQAVAPLAAMGVVVAGNAVTLSLTAAQSEGLPVVWVWDLQADDGGVLTTWLTGAGQTIGDVTRSVL